MRTWNKRTLRSRFVAICTSIGLALMGLVAFTPPAHATVYGDDYPAQWRNVPQDSVVDTWNELNRECTSFAAWRLHSRNNFEMPFHDNAGGWKADAQARGYTVNSTPTVGSVAWDSGHVAWVAEVNADNVTLEEYNWFINGGPATDGAYHTRTVTANSFQYIHFKDLGSTTGHTTDVGVWRAGTFILRYPSGSVSSIQFANSTDTPITGDWDGNGVTDVGVWRAGTFILRHADGSFEDVGFGNSTDTPITGDWDGNGVTDVGVWRAGWFFLRHADGSFDTIQFANSTDKPITGDWDGNGTTDIGVWRAGTFILRYPSGSLSSIQFANSTDTPVTGDWDGNGATGVGVWRAGWFYLRHPDGSFATIPFANSTDTPITGDWDGA